MPAKKKTTKKKTVKKTAKKTTKKKSSQKIARKSVSPTGRGMFIRSSRMIISTVPESLPGVYRPGLKIDAIFGHPRFIPVLAIALFGVTIASFFGALSSSAESAKTNCFTEYDGYYRYVDGSGLLTDKKISIYDKTPNVQNLLCEF